MIRLNQFGIKVFSAISLLSFSYGENVWVRGVQVQDSDWRTTVNGYATLGNAVTIPTVDKPWMGAEIDFSQNGWYDINKRSLNPDSTHSDSNMCWAGSASNLISWWLDQNKNYISDFNSIPHGMSSVPNVRGGETHTSQIYDDFCANFSNDYGSKAILGAWWYLTGFKSDDLYYKEVIDPIENAASFATRGGYMMGRMTTVNGADLENTLTSLTRRSDYAQLDNEGGTIYFDRFQNELLTAINSGCAVAISVPGHALTVWGAELDDETKKITSLYITDTDDTAQFGLRKYTCEVETTEEGMIGYAKLSNYGTDPDLQYIGTLMTLSAGDGLFNLVPEPSSAVLAMSALVFACGMRSRKRIN